MKRNTKVLVMILSTGAMLPMFGCLGGLFNAAIQGVPGTLLTEFLLDNDTVFDLFEDGNVTAATP